MVAAIIQARMSSTRLPGKVLMDLNGKELLLNVINRIKECKMIDKIVVATTTNDADDVLVAWCKDNMIEVFRGDENNVLKRYFDAATSINADIIVRVTSDDPFKDPEVIDAVIKQLIDNKLDFSFNNCPVSFPEGLDTEVFTYEAIHKAVEAQTSEFEREHVTQYFYHNPDIFKMKNYAYKEDISKIRLTIDSKEDLKLAKIIYSRLSPKGEMFFLEDILKLFREEPELAEINCGVKRSAMYE